MEQEKDREKERVGGRPAKLNMQKGDRDLERQRVEYSRCFVFFVLGIAVAIFFSALFCFPPLHNERGFQT